MREFIQNIISNLGDLKGSKGYTINQTKIDDSPWITHNEVGSGEPLKQYLESCLPKWKKTSEHQIPDNTPIKFKMTGVDGEMIGIKKPDYNSITCLNQKGNYDMIRLVSITEFIEI